MPFGRLRPVAAPAMMRDAGLPVAVRGKTVTELPPSLVMKSSFCACAAGIAAPSASVQKTKTHETMDFRMQLPPEDWRYEAGGEQGRPAYHRIYATWHT